MLRKYFVISLILSVVCSLCSAVMCARLKSVSAGEDHTLALADDNTLWACGWNIYYTLGLGSSVTSVYSLQRVRGENGIGFLQNVVTFDAGWEHSLAADANGTLWSWGYDNYGQLGNGPGSDPCDFPSKVHGLNNIGLLSDTVDIVCVSAGKAASIHLP